MKKKTSRSIVARYFARYFPRSDKLWQDQCSAHAHYTPEWLEIRKYLRLVKVPAPRQVRILAQGYRECGDCPLLPLQRARKSGVAVKVPKCKSPENMNNRKTRQAREDELYRQIYATSGSYDRCVGRRGIESCEWQIA